MRENESYFTSEGNDKHGIDQYIIYFREITAYTYPQNSIDNFLSDHFRLEKHKSTCSQGLLIPGVELNKSSFVCTTLFKSPFHGK